MVFAACPRLYRPTKWIFVLASIVSSGTPKIQKPVREHSLRPLSPQKAMTIYIPITKEGDNKMGSKRNRTRTHEFKVMLNDKENQLLIELAKISGLSRSEYLRSLLTGKSTRGFSEEFVQKRLGRTIRKAGKPKWQ